MKKIYCLIGKSAAGKDSVYGRFFSNDKCMELGLKNNVMYTTRPMRNGEIEGVNYHFVDDAFLEQAKKEGEVIECRTYHTVFGPWNYFTLAKSFDLENNDYLVSNTLEGYRLLKNYFGEEVVIPIYIYIEDMERLKRSLNREANPNCREICRRFLADEEDFSPANLIEAGIPMENCFENINLDMTVEGIREKILEYQKVFVKRK